MKALVPANSRWPLVNLLTATTVALLLAATLP